MESKKDIARVVRLIEFKYVMKSLELFIRFRGLSHILDTGMTHDQIMDFAKKAAEFTGIKMKDFTLFNGEDDLANKVIMAKDDFDNSLANITQLKNYESFYKLFSILAKEKEYSNINDGGYIWLQEFINAMVTALLVYAKNGRLNLGPINEIIKNKLDMSMREVMTDYVLPVERLIKKIKKEEQV